MGSSSKSNSSSTSKTSFAANNINNPFYHTSTDKKGNVTTNFVKGSAGETAYNYVNKNISGLLNDYLNPSLDSTVNKAKMNSFTKNLNDTTQSTMQNGIINPLANNGMLRSSQVANMSNNLQNQNTNAISDYSNELIGNSQNDTWNMINNLIGLYTQAYTGANNEAGQSIQAALGAGTTTTKSGGKAG